jgi:phage terminase large subunit GpA-like protein
MTPETSVQIQRAIRRGLEPLRTIEPLRLDEWADRFFYLSAESSYIEGRWTTLEIQRAIMVCISNDDIKTIVVKKSARVGYTKIIVAAVAYFAAHKRRNCAIWQPVDEDADDFVKDEIDPMLRDCEEVQRVFPSFGKKHKDNTLRKKCFTGSTLDIRGGKAGKNYRRLTKDVAILDELDGFDRDIEGEGDPRTLSAKRVEGATFPKQIMGSTPGLAGVSMIEDAVADCDIVLRYHVPCPHCGHLQPLVWGGPDQPRGIKWTDRDPATAAYACESCAALFSHSDYLAAMHGGLCRWQSDAGVWVDQFGDFRQMRNGFDELVPTPEHVAFDNYWTAYSWRVPWSQIVREFLRAKGDRGKLKSFTNTTLGETWAELDEAALKHDRLMERCEEYPPGCDVPAGGLVLVAFFDVQGDRLEGEVVAFADDLESWSVDYRVIEGAPTDKATWSALDKFLAQKWRHESGRDMELAGVGIDSGAYTAQVYAYTAGRFARRIYATKGQGGAGVPAVRSAKPGKEVRGRKPPRILVMGVDGLKATVDSCLRAGPSEPGRCHWPQAPAYSEEYFKMLTAEARITRRTARGETEAWVKLRARNESWDCRVGATAVLTHIQPQWRRLREQLLGDKPGDQNKDKRDRPPKRAGFVDRWRQ